MTDDQPARATDDQARLIDALFSSAGDLVSAVIASLSGPAQAAIAVELQAGTAMGLFVEIHPSRRLSCFIQPADGEPRTLFSLDSVDGSDPN